MVFSFFKRKGEEPQTMVPPKPVAPKPLAGTSATPAATAPSASPVEASDNFELEEFSYDGASASAESHSAVEEAAILYANERVSEAIAVLLGFIKENTEVRDLHPWLLLFDLYQTQNMRTPFEELSMEFVVRFERSAPVWEGPHHSDAAAAAPKSKMSSSVKLKGHIDQGQTSEIERLQKIGSGDTGVKLDLSEASAIASEQAALLAEVLQTLRRAEKRVVVSGGPAFAEKLKALVAGEATREKNYWRLLFEVYQVCGMQNEFEDAAVDYAVTFELSPPSWEVLSDAMQHAMPMEAEEEAPAQEHFSIVGVLATGTDYKLRDLERHADNREQVFIDMSATSRVDFVTVGAFINTLIALNQKGKQVTISGANEMVHALFDVMGVTEYATVMRRKSR